MLSDDKQALVYIPGLDGTGRLLYRQPGLHEGYRVVCESFPQDRPTTYEELAATAACHLEEAGGGRPGIVLAESFGGAVGLTVALSRPELVERLVLVNTFAYFPVRPLIRLGACLGRYFPDKPSHPATRRPRGWFFFSPDIPASVRDDWWQRTAGVPMRAFGRRIAMIAELDLRAHLYRIAVPSLVIAAPDDRVVRSTAGKELARLLPHAALLEWPVGHAALVHPRIDVAQLLAENRYWRLGSAV